MNAHNTVVLMMAFVLWPLGTRAQEPEDQMPEDQTVSLPAVLNGQGPSLTFQSEKIQTNYISGGISFTGAFTDNVLLSSANPESDFSYLIQPHISFSRTTPRLNWDVSVGAGLIVDQRFSWESQFAKSVALDGTYRLRSDLSLRLSDTFLDTTGLFSASNPAGLGSGVGVVEQPNNSLLVPPSQRTLGNTALAELNYQASPSSVAGFRGRIAILDYPSSSQNTQFGPLYNTRTYLGEAFFHHQISPRQWVGVAFRTQTFHIQGSTGDTDTSSLLFYYSLEASRSVTVSCFAGPEYYNTPQIPDAETPVGLFQSRQWTSAEGVTLDWKSERTIVTGGFSRQLSDGGGSSSAVMLTMANAFLRHQLGRHQEANFGVGYAANESIQPGYNFHGFYGSFAFQQTFGSSLFLRVGYTRQEQQLPNTRGVAAANISWISVTYSFSHLIGGGTSTKPAGRLPL